MGIKLPKVLKIDYRRWMCGGGKRNNVNDNVVEHVGHGTDTTYLLNQDNFMCCLGQFCLQAGHKRNEIMEIGDPDSVEGNSFPNKFCNDAININDDDNTTIITKVRKLQTLCKKYRKTLLLQNFPKKILDQLEHKNVYVQQTK